MFISVLVAFDEVKRTNAARLCPAPGGVSSTGACRGTHQQVGDAAAVADLGFEDEALTLLSGAGRYAGVTAELGCKDG